MKGSIFIKSRKPFFLLYFIMSMGLQPVSAQGQGSNTEEYIQRAHALHANIYRYFYDSTKTLFFETIDPAHNEKPHSYLWPLCAMVQAANEMEVLQPSRELMKPVMKAIDQYYSNKPPCPGYDSYVVNEGGGDRFYDDNQWIGLACADAWKRTRQQDLLRYATMIYRFMMSGYDTVSGGGLYWKEHDLTTKNTCSNGPGIILALRLYEATHQKQFLDTALLLYRWTNEHLLSPSGIYYDAIKLPIEKKDSAAYQHTTQSATAHNKPARKIDSAAYTYNTGTMIQAGVLLYRITGHPAYLQQAQRSAAASLERFYKNEHFPRNSWFNAVLMRGYIELFGVDKNKRYLEAMIHDADSRWKEDRDASGLFKERKGPPKLLEQAGWLEITARIAELKRQGF